MVPRKTQVLAHKDNPAMLYLVKYHQIKQNMEMRSLYLKIIVFLGCIPFLSQAQYAKSEASYMFNFANFTLWNSDFPTNNFEVVIFGSEEVSEEATKLFEGKSIQNHPAKVTLIKNIKDLNGTKPHILYVSYENIDVLAEAMNSTSKYGSLVIAEVKDTQKARPVIVFIVENNALKYAINFPEAEKRNLKFQDKLQKLAVKLPEYSASKK